MRKEDKQKIDWSVRNGHPLTYTIYELTEEEEKYLFDLLSYFMEIFGKRDYTDKISYCLKELIVNGEKANMKRLFFESKNLDLDDSKEYKEGIRLFKQEAMTNPQDFLSGLRDASLYVKVSFLMHEQTLKIWIRNNSKANEIEVKRIKDKMHKAHEFENIQDALLNSVDDEEGAGLGIIILSLMMKKLGIEKGGYDFKVTDAETQVLLNLPLDEMYSDQHALIYHKVAHEIDKLPPFPDYIVEIQKSIQDPSANIHQISTHVLRDRNLTANIISLANSSIYGMSGTISEVDEAIKIIGIGALENLMYSAGVESVFVKERSASNHFKRNNEIAELSLKLAKEYGVNRNLWESLYIGTYLHNIGAFSFEHLNPGVQEDLQGFCQDNHIPLAIMEDVFTGYNYSEVGTLLAEKWNFPDILKDIIQYHAFPAVYKGEYQKLVYIVHLALNLHEAVDKGVNILQLSFAVRGEFNIKTKKDLEEMMIKYDLIKSSGPNSPISN